jgi:hypothetical protein
MTDHRYSPLDVAVALSLYNYNVSPRERAQKIYDHFKGNCAELGDLVHCCTYNNGFIATALAAPSAAVYVGHALAKYGEEAKNRNRINLSAWDEIFARG